MAPLRVCYAVWPAEVVKWDQFNHLRVCNLHAFKKEDWDDLLLSPHFDIYVINFEGLTYVRQEVDTGLLTRIKPSHGFDLLVIDESTKVKDTQTQRFKALRPKLPAFKRRMILTGTPIPNGLQDLFGQMFVVDLGASLGKYVTHFRMEFCIQDPSGFGWNLRRGADEMIYRRVANNLMRLDAVDNLEMPELIHNTINVSLPTRGLRSAYKELEEKFYTEMENNPIAVANPAAVGMKLRQMANGFIYDDDGGMKKRETHWLHDEKIDALEELVDSLQGRPLLLAYEFEADAEAIMKRFDGGKLPMAVDMGKSKNPAQTIKHFNAGNIPLLIAHPASAGHGLNLQDNCHDVGFYGITWNREFYDQFIARVWRQGQKNPFVMVHSIVCQGTKDEQVVQVLNAKGLTQKKFNDHIKAKK